MMRFLCSYDENDGHQFFSLWALKLQDIVQKKNSIVLNVTPPKIIFEMIKMTVAIILIKNPDNLDWKIFGGCVFVMLAAIYFSFAKTFDESEHQINIHSAIGEIDAFNVFIMNKLKFLLNFIAHGIVCAILLFWNVVVGLLIFCELPFHLAIRWIPFLLHCLFRPRPVSPDSADDRLEQEAKKEDEAKKNDKADEVYDFIGSEDEAELCILLQDCSVESESEPEQTPESINDSVLKEQMRKWPTRFCFIKCLKSSDKESFICEYIHVLNVDKAELKYFERGYIKVSTWLCIMKTIDLRHRYCVYRESYWGENTGRPQVSPQKVSYKSLLVEFGKDHQITCVNLLIADKHISRIHMFRRSNVVNLDQGFWDTIIGLFK